MKNFTISKNSSKHPISYGTPLSLITLSFGIALTISSQTPVKAAGVVTQCNEAGLTQALAGGGTVTFSCGTSPVTISITSEKLISANTTIDGGNKITLDGGGKTRIFNMASGIQFSVSNLTIANGYTTDQGAAINNSLQGTLTVTNSKFNNNVSNKAGEFGGGAIYSGPLGTLTVAQSNFTSNKANLGGAIRILNSNLNVTNSTFTGNSAVGGSQGVNGNGGAIYIDGANGDNGTIVLSNSTFTNNTATFFGGAFFNNIYNKNATNVDKSTFSGNRVTNGNSQGGAIWSTGDPASGGAWVSNVNNSKFTLTNSTLSGNYAEGQGGGIWLGRHPVAIKITNTTVSGNIANRSNGGGIVLGDNGTLTVTNSTIYGNRVNGQYALGGGFVISSGKANINYSTIAGNYASWQAGGIANLGNAPVTLTSTIIANNKANNGGNNWNITNNCFLTQMINNGNNIQFPAPNPNNSQDISCVPGITIADPKLGPLTNNGGPTQTALPLAGSAAIDQGSSSFCPTTDQRGVTRPKGLACDVGAVEAQ